MNFNNDVFRINGHEFSCSCTSTKVVLRQWNREQRVVRPIIVIAKGEIHLCWSDERVPITFHQEVQDGEDVIVYDIPAIKTFESIPALANPYRYCVGKRHNDNFIEFVERFFLDILYYFDDIKTTF